MGQRALPSIDGILSALEVVTNPEKYITYMKEFRRLHEEVVNSMGEYAKKETLEASIAKLAADRAVFEKEKSESRANAAKNAAELEHNSLNLEKQIEKYRKEVEKEDAKLAAHEQEANKKYAEADRFVKEQEALWSIKFQELAASTANLQAREDALAAAKAKIEPVAKALGAVLE